MAKPDHSLDPLILASARWEFLEKGFEKASLKHICENANVTTGALYKRYSGKEELFAAVVADTVADLNQIIAQKSVTDFSQVSDEALVKAWDMDEDYMMWWFRYLDERHDGFVLLVSCAENTRYANFQHDWVEKMSQATYGYYQEARRRELTTVDMSEAEIHLLLSAFGLRSTSRSSTAMIWSSWRATASWSASSSTGIAYLDFLLPEKPFSQKGLFKSSQVSYI